MAILSEIRTYIHTLSVFLICVYAVSRTVDRSDGRVGGESLLIIMKRSRSWYTMYYRLDNLHLVD